MTRRGDEQWDAIRAIFHAARRLSREEREEYLRDACEGNPALRKEVESLLRHEDSDFLDQPALLDAVRLADFAHAESAEEGADPGSTPDDEPTFGSPAIPGYRIIRSIGSGGMGIVYEAQQQSPRRSVAIKVLRSIADDEDRSLRRFRREAQMLARLEHPAIVRIVESGHCDDGRPFIAMELVRGSPLSRWAAAARPSRRACIELFIELSRAVHAAHIRGIIHRDLKPSNVLIDDEGRPHILDFGLAAERSPDRDEHSLLTQVGQVMGTLPWMSPEQVSGRGTDVDARSDIYAIGVMLYEVLVRAAPYDLSDRSIPEAARIICEHTPRSPGSVNAALRGDLETILLKAIEKDPARRYASADALAEDLERFLGGHPITARPASAAYHLRRLVARHRIASALAALLLLLIIVFGAVGSTLALRFAQQRDLAEARRVESELLSYRHGIALSRQLLTQLDRAGARRVLNNCPAEHRAWEWYWLQHLSTRGARTIETPGARIVVTPAAIDDPPLLVVQPRANALEVRALHEQDLLHRFELESETISTVVSDSLGQRIAAGSVRGLLVVWDLRSGRELLRAQPMERPIDRIVFDGHGEKLLVGTSRGGSAVLDATSGAIIHSFQGVDVACFTEDGGALIIARGESLSIFDLREGTEVARTSITRPQPAARSDDQKKDDRITGLATLRDRDQFISTHSYGELRIWDQLQPDLNSSRILASSAASMNHLAVCSRSETIVTVDAQRIATVIHPESGSVTAWPLDLNEATALGIDPEGKWFWAAARHGRIVVQTLHPDIDANAAAMSPEDLNAHVQIDPVQSRILVGRRDGSVHLRSVGSNRERSIMPEVHAAPITAAAFAGSAERAVTGDAHGGLSLWDLSAPARVAERGPHRAEITALTLSPDGTLVLAADASGTLCLWDVRTGSVREIAAGIHVSSMVTDWQRRHAVMLVQRTLEDQPEVDVLRRIDLDSGRDLAVTDSEEGTSVTAIALDPESGRIATGNEKGSITVRGGDDLRPLMTLSGHDAAVLSAAFSRCGRRLISGSLGGTIHVWAFDDAEPLLTLHWPRSATAGIAFTAEDRAIITNDVALGRVRLWSPDDAR